MTRLPGRILIYGVTGSGKTTLARQVGAITGLPWHSVDDEIGWLPDWLERPRDEQRQLASQIATSERKSGWPLYASAIELAHGDPG